eukprot:RCo011066
MYALPWAWLQAWNQGKFLDPEVAFVEEKKQCSTSGGPAGAHVGGEPAQATAEGTVPNGTTLPPGSSTSPMNLDETPGEAKLTPSEHGSGPIEVENSPLKPKEKTSTEAQTGDCSETRVIPRSIPTAELLCPHERLAPVPRAAFKIVPREAGELLHRQFGGRPLALPGSFCEDCAAVVLAQHMGERDRRAAKESALVTLRNTSPKTLQDESTGFYVSSWWLREWSKANASPAELGENQGPLTGLVCPHGSFALCCPQRRLIPNSVWEAICAEFPARGGAPAAGFPFGCP